MSLTPQERKIVEYGKSQGKSKEETVRALAEFRSKNVSSPTPSSTPEKQGMFGVPTPSGVLNAGKDIAIGAGKGLLDTAISTTRLLIKGGQPIQAALDPTRDLAQVKKDAESSPLFGPQADRIDEQLTATNPAQKTGKVMEFIGSLLYPVGRAEEVASLASKGKEVIGASFDGLGSRLSSISDDVADGGSKVKDTLIDVVSNLDDKTKTALQRTPRELFDRFVEQGRQAMMDDRNRTPLEAVGDSVINALKQVDEMADNIGAQKQEYLKFNGISGFKGEALRRFNEGMTRFKNSHTLVDSDNSVVNQILTQFKKLGDTPALSQVDRFVDFAQSKLYTSARDMALPTTTKTIGAMRKLIGELNTALKSQLPEEYGKLNAQYADAKDFITELNARLGKEGAGAGALIKRLFSPSDAHTKELFEKLEQMVGADFFRDARLAKFVMDVLGDTRGKSLLEELPTSASGMLAKGIDYAKKAISDPINAARRYIDRRK